MPKTPDRIVYRRKPGEWIEKSVLSGRAESIHTTQGAAINAAHKTLENKGGGELITKAENGRFRSKDTVAPGKDPFPPKDTEH